MKELEQLRDIHLPEPISWWPPAPGWWALLISSLILIVAGVLLWNYLQKQKQSVYAKLKRELLTIERSFAHQQDSQKMMQGMLQLLKLTAMYLHGRKSIAALHGHEWLAFLHEHYPAIELSPNTRECIADGLYRSDPAINTSDFSQQVKLLIDTMLVKLKKQRVKPW